MARATQKRGGVEVEGLAESIRALNRLDGKYRKEAVETFRDAAKDIQKRSQSKIGAGGYRGPKPKIGRSATRTGAGVKLRAGVAPWGLGAEFGEIVGDVHGQRVGQYRYRRRTMPTFKPPTSSDLLKNRGGYMIQPTIRARLPFWEREVARRISELINRAMRKAKVPRGR